MAGETPAAIEKTVVDAWDYHGQAAIRSKSGGRGRAAMILVVELNERLTTLGIAVNLVPYLTGTMHLGNAAAANVVTNFLGTSFMLCLLGGFVADTFLGRYRTIAIFAAVQAAGVSILTISTAVKGLQPSKCTAAGDCLPATGAQLGVLYLSLYLTALGTGGLKSSVSGFGSDQFDEKDPSERKMMMMFFTWLFFFISLGSLMATTLLVYVQDYVGREWGYGIISVSIMAGLAVFLSGTKGYRYKKLAGSPLTQIASVVAAALTKRGLRLPENSSDLYEVSDVVCTLAAAEEEEGKRVAGKGKHAKQRLPHTDKLRWLDRAAIVEDNVDGRSKWRLSTVTDVEEVKSVIGMLPIWAATILFWTVYAQLTTFSVAQAISMDRHMDSLIIPSGSLTVFFVAATLFTVPFYDRIIVPIARRLTSNPNGVTPLQRIGVGITLSIFGMAVGALVELKRLRAFWSSSSSDLNVLYLVPQFIIVGAGEAFTYIGQLGFFLRECPPGMKTMSTGLFLSSLAAGFFLSTALVAAVNGCTGHRNGSPAWLPDDLNQGRLYNFYWLLAVLSAINLGAFLLCARAYVYKERKVDTAVEGVVASIEEDELIH